MTEETTKTEPKQESPAKEKAAKEKKYQSQYSLTDPLQQKLVCCIMKAGKKSVAERILKHTLEEMFRRGQENPLKVFEKAVENAKPAMEVKPRRVGGSIYQIPVEVPAARQQSLAIRWILDGAKKRKGQPMFKKLAAELMDASSETGYAFTKREDAHRMAQSNKAFAHLARY